MVEALHKLKAFSFHRSAAGGGHSRRSSSADASCFGFRRRKTLKKLLSSCPASPQQTLCGGAFDELSDEALVEKKGFLRAGRSLKDLFMSSPPLEETHGDGGVWRRLGRTASYGGGVGRRIGVVGLRYRLLRRSWRPGLGVIPETRTEDDVLLL
ncbi:hypothetical protein HPP92_000462 [Vanilla planifolia]|uniref:Uncharacterized protein n=1 Tax=Vanilla planifolia TaxID=51239 RepID=A0A835RXI3_VANPL|nr:hypothetical protein HPP92_000462 [Vanilla planifolia]